VQDCILSAWNREEQNGRHVRFDRVRHVVPDKRAPNIPIVERRELGSGVELQGLLELGDDPAELLPGGRHEENEESGALSQRGIGGDGEGQGIAVNLGRFREKVFDAELQVLEKVAVLKEGDRSGSRGTLRGLQREVNGNPPDGAADRQIG
jgi:hypothetical protein